MDKKVIEAINDQINLELYSAYIYLAYSVAMERANYRGYSKWLMEHGKEEIGHGMDFLEFLQKRDESATLQDVKAENFVETEPLTVAKAILAHEKKVTESIYRLHDISKKAGDYATEIFTHGYISEQIEEEDLALTIVDKFTFAGKDTSAKYSADQELEIM